jgi:hypothetical protein
MLHVVTTFWCYLHKLLRIVFSLNCLTGLKLHSEPLYPEPWDAPSFYCFYCHAEQDAIRSDTDTESRRLTCSEAGQQPASASRKKGRGAANRSQTKRVTPR